MVVITLALRQQMVNLICVVMVILRQLRGAGGSGSGGVKPTESWSKSAWVSIVISSGVVSGS